MRLPLPSTLHRFLLATNEVARENARETLEVLAQRRQESEDTEAFIRALPRRQPRDLARRDLAQ